MDIRNIYLSLIAAGLLGVGFAGSVRGAAAESALEGGAAEGLSRKELTLQSKLYDAIKYGRIVELPLLIAEGANLNKPLVHLSAGNFYPEESSPIKFAISNASMVAALIALGVRLDL